MSNPQVSTRAERLNLLAREEIQSTYRIIEPILAGTSRDHKLLVAQCNKMHLLSLIVRASTTLTVEGDFSQGAIPQINYARTQLGQMPISAEFKSALEDILLAQNGSVEHIPQRSVGAWAQD